MILSLHRKPFVDGAADTSITSLIETLTPADFATGLLAFYRLCQSVSGWHWLFWFCYASSVLDLKPYF